MHPKPRNPQFLCWGGDRDKHHEERDEVEVMDVAIKDVAPKQKVKVEVIGMDVDGKENKNMSQTKADLHCVRTHTITCGKKPQI